MDNLCNFRCEFITIGNDYQKYGALNFYKIGNIIFVAGAFTAYTDMKFENIIPQWARPNKTIKISGQIQKAYGLKNGFDLSFLYLNSDLSIRFSASSSIEGFKVPLFEPVFYLTNN